MTCTQADMRRVTTVLITLTTSHNGCRSGYQRVIGHMIILQGRATAVTCHSHCRSGLTYPRRRSTALHLGSCEFLNDSSIAFCCKSCHSSGFTHRQGKSQVCDIKTEDYCFTGRGSQADLTNAWAVLQLVARFQISRMVVEGMYTMALVPPDEPGFGKGLTLDFVSLLKDFYNGAYGDSALAAVPLIDTVGTLFLFAPYDLGKVQELWAENARGI